MKQNKFIDKNQNVVSSVEWKRHRHGVLVNAGEAGSHRLLPAEKMGAISLAADIYNTFQVFKKLTHFNPEITLLGVYPKEKCYK